MLRLWQYNSLITLYLHSNITCNLKNPNSLPKNDYQHHITVIIVPRMMIIHTIIQILQTVCAHNWKLREQLFLHDKCNSRGVNHEHNGEKKKEQNKDFPFRNAWHFQVYFCIFQLRCVNSVLLHKCVGFLLQCINAMVLFAHGWLYILKWRVTRVCLKGTQNTRLTATRSEVKKKTKQKQNKQTKNKRQSNRNNILRWRSIQIWQW